MVYMEQKLLHLEFNHMVIAMWFSLCLPITTNKFFTIIYNSKYMEGRLHMKQKTTKEKEQKTTQSSLVKDYFLKRPNRDISHPEVVDYVTAQWKELTGTVFRDPDRAIRKLYQEGLLVKVKKGVYKYDPKVAKSNKIITFTDKQKDEIWERDGHRCVICGQLLRREDAHFDHIVPMSKGGKSEISNGQTLCSEHNIRKKNYGCVEDGKRSLLLQKKLAEKLGDSKRLEFIQAQLALMEKYHIDEHVPNDLYDKKEITHEQNT